MLGLLGASVELVRVRASTHGTDVWIAFFLESIFQDPCPTLNGTRRITMPQVLTRRREPITLLAKRGRLHLQTQKLALVVITQEAEAHSLCSISLSLSLVHWQLPVHAEQLHPSPRLS